MAQILETVLLLALPASGKSEVRKYLAQLSPQSAANDFHMGPTVQLDDFPYVHLMRRVDDELEAKGQARLFFQSGEKPFKDARDWGTLIELVNQDHAALVAKKAWRPERPGEALMARLDAAAATCGLPARCASIDAATKAQIATAIDKESRQLADDLAAGMPDTLSGKTLVIEFARGGPQGSSMPLSGAFGYQHSIGGLSPAILEKARILYIWVTPEESRRKNAARTDPNDPGSILHHGVPIDVMLGDYGCDDMDHLEATARKPGTVTVQSRGKSYDLPIARFDNRVDKTSFIRNDSKDWKPDEVKAVHEGLQGALEKLARF